MFGTERGAGGGVRVLRVMDSHTADDVCTLVHNTAVTQEKKDFSMLLKEVFYDLQGCIYSLKGVIVNYYYYFK